MPGLEDMKHEDYLWTQTECLFLITKQPQRAIWNLKEDFPDQGYYFQADGALALVTGKIAS